MRRRAPKSHELTLLKVAESLIIADFLSNCMRTEEERQLSGKDLVLDIRRRQEERVRQQEKDVELVLRHAPEVARRRYSDGFVRNEVSDLHLADARRYWSLSQRPVPDLRRMVAKLKALAKAAQAFELAWQDVREDADLHGGVLWGLAYSLPSLSVFYGLDVGILGLSDEATHIQYDERPGSRDWLAALERRKREIDWVATAGVPLLRRRVDELTLRLDFRSPRTSPLLRACLWRLAYLWRQISGEVPTYSQDRDALAGPQTTRFERFAAEAVPGVLQPGWEQNKPRALRDVVDVFRHQFLVRARR
jgi:hypothetical protein